MYNPTEHNGESIWIDHLPKDGVTSFPLTFPTEPCELIISHASDNAHPYQPWLTANFSLTKGDLGNVNPKREGNTGSILCYGKNVSNGGAVTASYIAPGSACFLNVSVAANNRQPIAGPTTTFGLLCNRQEL